ncbi:hypothetical protein [Microbacterium sp. Marseille-Q6965]|uniref:hypothetical protein n=1 Tax=Microbacterium sp. Marseille-Q6965 TaxID=2965072 RepID=UPI0021B77C77|nr:hypothetical protein [Microbacterium sp. Marseille-Q6965]
MDEWISAIAESVAAVAALGALGAAIVAARHTKKLLRTESERDEHAAVERKRAVARRVSAWVAVAAQAPATDEATGQKPNHVYGVIVSNASDEVVYDVQVDVIGAGGASADRAHDGSTRHLLHRGEDAPVRMGFRERDRALR